MKTRREYIGDSIALSLLLVTTAVIADESAPTSEFTYTDDWAVVSAPPPPGPYRAVNIDPRVPGVDAIPPISMDSVAPSADADIPAEAMANAPAAGIPATRPPQDSPAAALVTQQPVQPVAPGRVQRVTPSPQGYYPAPSRYPAQTSAIPPSGYPAYRNQPAYGYYGSPAYPQGQQQVPPPPVYDSSSRNQPPYGHPSGRGTP
jgi:hypothetical protein